MTDPLKAELPLVVEATTMYGPTNEEKIRQAIELAHVLGDIPVRVSTELLS